MAFGTRLPTIEEKRREENEYKLAMISFIVLGIAGIITGIVGIIYIWIPK